MRFIYPARVRRAGPAEVVVSFRDLPECLTSGRDEAEALTEAGDVLEEAIAGRIVDGEPIPRPSARRAREHRVAVPPTTAANAALVLAFRDSGLSRVAFARRLGVDDKVVRRMLDPRHATAANRLHKALHLLGCELVAESALGPDCVFPLISGATGPAMRDLVGGGAQRLLDREDIDRGVLPR